MKIQPLADRIVVKVLEAKEVTKGGIVLPDTAKEKPQEAEVIAVGKGKISDEGKIIPPEVKAGDKIQLKCRDKQKQRIKELVEAAKDRTIPKWLKADPANISGEILGVPERADVGFPIKEQLIIELYSK